MKDASRIITTPQTIHLPKKLHRQAPDVVLNNVWNTTCHLIISGLAGDSRVGDAHIQETQYLGAPSFTRPSN